ncbi:MULTISPECIES: acyltransferase family protein [unclassified Nocardioides]|uniref:acyltransferase family protein n=1 Tax=unclassified Nocardioides TaxID=2615069 RepID=UPI00361B474C
MAVGTDGRVDYLDGIRAVAIAAVLALHWFSWYVPLFHGGSIGVDLFFVLSGFIITTVLWRAPTDWSAWGAFLRRRVVRLYPALLGLVVGAVVLYAVVPTAPVDAVEVARRGVLALTQTSSLWAAGQDGSLWLPGLQPFGQTWSLAVEWGFYLLWPGCVIGARRAGWSARRLAAVALVVAAVAYAASLPLGAFWFYFGPADRSAELLVGAALALWTLDRPATTTRSELPAVLALVAVAAYALLAPDALSPVYRYLGVPLAVVAAVVLIRTGYAGGRGPVTRLLGHPWLATTGRHSYSLYLWHVVPFLLLEEAPGPKPLLGLAAVASAIGLTVLSYRYLERPFLRPRGDLLRPRTEPVRPTPARPASPAA